jgi:phosphoribosyl-AMP cyclohydrolase
MHYWSRSRNELWHKGASSGFVQRVKDISIDCDQDCLLASIEVSGENETACHTGRQSCFYRFISKDKNGNLKLKIKRGHSD